MTCPGDQGGKGVGSHSVRGWPVRHPPQRLGERVQFSLLGSCGRGRKDAASERCAGEQSAQG